MHPIDRAIREKRRLRFIYHGVARLVEPQCRGIGHRGTELLRAYQLEGGVQAEPLFDVSKISDLQVLDEHFGKPGPNYKRGDSAMREILRSSEYSSLRRKPESILFFDQDQNEFRITASRLPE